MRLVRFLRRADFLRGAHPLSVGPGLYPLAPRSVTTAIRIRNRRDPHPAGHAFPARTVRLVGADVDERGAVPVVGGVLNNQLAATGRGTCQSQRQLVCLGGRIEQKDRVQPFGKE